MLFVLYKMRCYVVLCYGFYCSVIGCQSSLASIAVRIWPPMMDADSDIVLFLKRLQFVKYTKHIWMLNNFVICQIFHTSSQSNLVINIFHFGKSRSRKRSQLTNTPNIPPPTTHATHHPSTVTNIAHQIKSTLSSYPSPSTHQAGSPAA